MKPTKRALQSLSKQAGLKTFNAKCKVHGESAHSTSNAACLECQRGYVNKYHAKKVEQAVQAATAAKKVHPTEAFTQYLKVDEYNGVKIPLVGRLIHHYLTSLEREGLSTEITYNELSATLKVGRDIVMSAIKALKESGLISSTIAHNNTKTYHVLVKPSEVA